MRSTSICLAVTTIFLLTAWERATAAVLFEQNSVPVVASYYPHWVSRSGAVTENIMSRLPAHAIVAAHHSWSIEDVRRVLDFPGKGFIIAWYVETDVHGFDDPAPQGMPVSARIAEAKWKQESLVRSYGAKRFSNLIELDAARDKKDGHLHGEGNQQADWLKDAVAVRDAGFHYVAKSPALDHIRELRSKLGKDFVPRIVFEDITGGAADDNPGYARDAKALAARGEILTLVVHEGAHGGFPSTPLDRAISVVAADFNRSTIEVYWGRTVDPAGFVRLRGFPGEERNNLTASRG